MQNSFINGENPITSVVTTTTRNPKEIIRKDGKGNILSHSKYDAWGRTTYYKGSEPWGEFNEYEYEYDIYGNITYYHNVLTGYKEYKKYDSNGQILEYKNTDGVEEIFEIEYYPLIINHTITTSTEPSI